jgi:hypothetical protein
MSSLTPIDPFASILAAAAEIKPSPEVKQKVKRSAAAGSLPDRVLLLDCSGSMAGQVGGLRKIEILAMAIERLNLTEWRIFTFNSSVQESRYIPEPSGGTDMGRAIELIARECLPAETLIVGDGLPDSEAAALRAAKKLPGIISTLYVGPDRDIKATEFMLKLARQGGGRAHVQDLTQGPQRLASAMKLLGAGN